MMKRRLAIASVAAALLAGGAGVATADENRATKPTKPGNQFCVLFYTDRGPIPDKLCVNWLAPERRGS